MPTQKGEPRPLAILAGVRKMPTPMTSMTTSAVRAGIPRRRRGAFAAARLESPLGGCRSIVSRQFPRLTTVIRPGSPETIPPMIAASLRPTALSSSIAVVAVVRGMEARSPPEV